MPNVIHNNINISTLVICTSRRKLCPNEKSFAGYFGRCPHLNVNKKSAIFPGNTINIKSIFLLFIQGEKSNSGLFFYKVNDANAFRMF